MIVTSDRRKTDAKKWHKYAGRDIIPLWIADSDFEVAPSIRAAIEQRVRHSVFGYPYDEPCFLDAVVTHCAAAYDWRIEREWIVTIPGCVPGLNFCRGVSLMRGKSAALVPIPTYPPFFNASAMLDFTHLKVQLTLGAERWAVDFERLDAAVTDATGLLLLCHPHNPVGRVYPREELDAFANIARTHDLIVCSDEIHCDLVLNGTRHIPFASLDSDTLARTITLMAPSKTFNIAGMCCAFAIIADATLRNQFQRCAVGFNEVNVIGRVAAAAAYSSGEDWRTAQIAYLRASAARIEQRVNALPGVHVTPVEATYLAFIDCRGLELDNPQRYFESKGLGFADGADYGMPGFVRMNFACDHALLDEALDHFERAVCEVTHG